ncbi:MAG: zf-HC2 domain-containing protein, partial [Acidobacteriota bacterium]
MKRKIPEEAIRRIIARQAAGGAGACIDENAFAAYLEGSLAAAETAKVEAHAAGCLRCQEVLGLLMRTAEAEQAGGSGDAEVTPAAPRIPVRLALPLASLAAAVFFIVAGIIVFRNDPRLVQKPRAVQVAESRTSPASPQAQAPLEAASASREKEQDEQIPARAGDRGSAAQKDLPAPGPEKVAEPAPPPAAQVQVEDKKGSGGDPVRLAGGLPSGTPAADPQSKGERIAGGVVTGAERAEKGAVEMAAASAERETMRGYLRQAALSPQALRSESDPDPRAVLRRFAEALPNLPANEPLVETGGRMLRGWDSYWIDPELLQ